MTNSFTQVFGGGTITSAYPSYISYLLNVTTPQITLVWPTEFVVSPNYVANIIEVSSTAGTQSLVMPDATLVSVGQASLFTNTGANTVVLYANDGTTVITNLTAATSTYVYLLTNTTTNGTFRVIPWATGTPSIVSINAVSLNSNLTVTGGPITSSGTFTFNLTGIIGSLSTISSTGLLTYIGSNTITSRTITGTANQITVVNGSGVAGNPTISLPSAVSGITSLTASNVQLGVVNTNVISTADGNPLQINAPLSLTPLSAVASPLRWYTADGAHYLAFQGPATAVANVTWTLPNADGTNGYVLTTNGAGTLSWTAAGAGTVNSVSGTLNRITSTGGTNPIIDISAAYVGQSSITTLGTVGTGTWQATPVVVSFGGTGATTFNAYGVICGGTLSTGMLQSISPGTNNYVLTSNGAGALPSWKVLNPLINIIYKTSGTAQTFTPSSTAVNSILVILVGGGGGGGGVAATTAQGAAGGGGGGGATLHKYIQNIGPSYTATYTVGTGGAGGSAGNNPGSNGNATTWSDGTFTLSAGGGVGAAGGAANGSPAGGGLGADGGTATGGDLNITGGNGGNSYSVQSAGYAIGGAAGGTSIGPPTSFTMAFNTAVVGGTNAPNTGVGGGGAAAQGTNAAQAGGGGGSGFIIIYEYA